MARFGSDHLSPRLCFAFFSLSGRTSMLYHKLALLAVAGSAYAAPGRKHVAKPSPSPEAEVQGLLVIWKGEAKSH